MEQDWTGNIPTVVYFVVGLGGVAGALLALVKLKEAVVPDANSQVKKDIATIRADIHDIRARVGMLAAGSGDDRSGDCGAVDRADRLRGRGRI